MGLSEFPVEYSLGDWVQVREGYPDHHFRTPKYVQGKIGRIEGLCGIFPNPEQLAYGGDGLPKQPLYHVGFTQTNLWNNYSGPPIDKVSVDIYQHWLTPQNGVK